MQERGGGGVSLAWCQVRTALRFALGLVVGENYEWCLVIAVVFMQFEKAGAKRCGGRFQVINWGGNGCHKRMILFIGKGRGGLTM